MKRLAMMAAALSIAAIPQKTLALTHTGAAPKAPGVLATMPSPAADAPTVKVDPADPLGAPMVLIQPMPVMPALPPLAPLSGHERHPSKLDLLAS